MKSKKIKAARVIHKPSGRKGHADIPNGWDDKEARTMVLFDPEPGKSKGQLTRVKDLRWLNESAKEMIERGVPSSKILSAIG